MLKEMLKNIDIEIIDWSIIVSWIGTIIGLIINITPFFQFINIIRGKEKIYIINQTILVFNIICSELFTCYWLRQNVFVPCLAGALSFGLSEILIIIFLYYISKKRIGRFLLYLLIELVIIYFFYHFLLYVVPTYQVVGTISVFFYILTFFHPVLSLIQIIYKGNYKAISLGGSFGFLIFSLAWLVFGILVKDNNVIISHSIGLSFSVTNIILWIFFYCDREKEDNNKNEKVKDKEKRENEESEDGHKISIELVEFKDNEDELKDELIEKA